MIKDFAIGNFQVEQPRADKEVLFGGKGFIFKATCEKRPLVKHPVTPGVWKNV